jgi:hypothetical protein
MSVVGGRMDQGRKRGVQDDTIDLMFICCVDRM